MKKNILFITGTRADFGKIRSLILNLQDDDEFDVHVFVTGMHMHALYGKTYIEVEKSGAKNIFKYINQSHGDSMDRSLAQTIFGLSNYIAENQPDLIVVHGDRVEALAGAIVGSLNNILVAHIEGGELSGTVDEVIRHAISKLSHLHFVANDEAAKRLVQLGEKASHVYAIGSPDLDVMNENTLPPLEEVKRYYDIAFDRYGIIIFHPVTTEIDSIRHQTDMMMSAAEQSELEWIVIYPNNDHGTDLIMDVYHEYMGKDKFRFFPSIRFDSFLALMKNATLILGNSSAGIREAPFYGVPAINIGSRQQGRSRSSAVFDVQAEAAAIIQCIDRLKGATFEKSKLYGDGKSTERFVACLKDAQLWNAPNQKIFVDM